jgi:hypothetical protein
VSELRKPWRHDDGFYDDVLDADGNTIAECDAPDSAAEIVRCVNAFDDLLAACELAIKDHEAGGVLLPFNTRTALLVAVHKAKGTPNA